MITKVQRRVLKVMMEYDTTVMTITGRGGGHAFFRGLLGISEKKVRPRTIWALERKGLVENITASMYRWKGSEYRITESGREALL